MTIPTDRAAALKAAITHAGQTHRHYGHLVGLGIDSDVTDDERNDARLTSHAADDAIRAAVQSLIDEAVKAHDTDLRRSLWLGHGCEIAILYGDDGEMQCGRCLIDFKRLPVDDIAKRLRHVESHSRAIRSAP